MIKGLIIKRISLFKRFMVESATHTFDQLPSIQKLVQHHNDVINKTHLRELLPNEDRNKHLRAQLNDEIILDLTHAKIDQEGFNTL